ncbi:MAG: tetratricopeptide repeat protein [Candidatus Eisenbacteria bacterium]|uniref:Tetratricopeptide repeat protein n=1 Tax=Eiseniibacteriota bacterium TaxID=2212470 RepID=A0A933SFU3_UNCEI|nr:tetratricopeptide repeat protein [Candidatus Eisenbacteria bacterium]
MPRKPRRPRTNPATGEPVVDALALARACLQSNEPDMAELWLRAWEDKSENSEVRAARCLDAGRVLETAGHFDRALAHLAAGLALEPVHEETAYFLHNNTGYILGQQGRHAQAERFCRAALRVDRLRYNAMKNLGNALAGQGRHAEASLHLMHACTAGPGDPRALHHLEALAAAHRGALLVAWPDLDWRLAEFRRRIEPRPGRSAPVFGDGVSIGGPEGSPSHEALGHARCAVAHFNVQGYADAVEECDLGLAFDPPSYPMRRWLTLIRARSLVFLERDAQEALDSARDAIEMDPFEGATWRVYGVALAAVGRHSDATRAYLNAIRLDFADGEALALLRTHVRRFGTAIEANIPDIRKRVSRLAAAMKKEKAARDQAMRDKLGLG